MSESATGGVGDRVAPSAKQIDVPPTQLSDTGSAMITDVEMLRECVTRETAHRTRMPFLERRE